MQFNYIAATAQSELWSKSGPILLLGSWCRPGLDKVEPIEYTELACIWESDFSLVEAEAYCWGVFRHSVPLLARSLNSLHDVNHSERYWEVLLSVWFLHFINTMYDRYLVVKSASAVGEGAHTTTFARESYTIPASAFDGLKAAAYDDKHNLQLFSEVFRFLGLPVVDCDSRVDEMVDNQGVDRRENSGPRLTGRNLLANIKHSTKLVGLDLLYRWRTLASGWDDNVLIYSKHLLRHKDLFVICALSGATAYSSRSNGAKLKKHKPAFELRNQLSKDLTVSTATDDFETLVLGATPYFIPLCFVEGYQELTSGSRDIFGSRAKHLLFNAPGFYDSPYFMEYAARCAQARKLLVSAQHGGAGYGHTLSSPAERIEIELCDRFITFGWEYDLLPNRTIPLPSPHLSALKRASRRADVILYVSFFGKRYLHRLVSLPHASQWDNYLDYCETFLKTLSPGQLTKIRFRPFYLRSYQYPPLTAALLNGPQCEHRPASQALSDCSLAVIDHASTSWLEAFAIDVPTILFWNPAHWRFRAAAQPYVDELRKVGILYYDSVSAARKAEEIYPHVDEWWHQDDVRRARVEFCKRYVWATSDWRRHWIRELKNLV